MSLTDLMSGADLALYPEIAMWIFLVTYFAVAARIFWRRRPDDFISAAALPLSDGCSIDQTTPITPSARRAQS